MAIINIQAAKTHLSRLVEQAAQGEEIILAKAGKPIARLVPYSINKGLRKGGQLKGQIWEASNCWDAGEDLMGASIDAPLYATETEKPDQAVAEEAKQ